MATIHKLTKDGSTIFPATITDAIVHPNTGKTLTSMIKDYNVSELFPSEGLDGGNKYNLALAIQVLGSHLTAAEKTGGIKITFISSVSPYPEEEYYLNKNTWSTTLSDWGQRFEVGDVIADPSGSWEQGTAEQYIDQQTAILTTNLASETVARQTVDSNLQTQINTEVSTRTASDNTQNGRIGVLEEAYRNLTESDVIVGPRPSSGQQANVIYREPDQGHTPPQFYCDYMWYDNDWVLMAQYDNGIDNNPLPNSNNLVKSSGVFNSMGAFDISAYNSNHIYQNLTEALAGVPNNMKAGGMSVKFIQEITPAKYNLVKTEGLTTEPTGTELSSDPNLVSGTYTAAQLNNLSTVSALPTTLNSSKTYYLEVAGDSTTYTTWVVTYVSTSDNKYVQYRLMSDTFNATVANWQGVDNEPTVGSDNLVSSHGIANNTVAKVTTAGAVYGSWKYSMVSGHVYYLYKKSGNVRIYTRETSASENLEQITIIDNNTLIRFEPLNNTGWLRILADSALELYISEDKMGIYDIAKHVNEIGVSKVDSILGTFILPELKRGVKMPYHAKDGSLLTISFEGDSGFGLNVENADGTYFIQTVIPSGETSMTKSFKISQDIYYIKAVYGDITNISVDSVDKYTVDSFELINANIGILELPSLPRMVRANYRANRGDRIEVSFTASAATELRFYDKNNIEIIGYRLVIPSGETSLNKTFTLNEDITKVSAAYDSINNLSIKVVDTGYFDDNLNAFNSRQGTQQIILNEDIDFEYGNIDGNTGLPILSVTALRTLKSIPVTDLSELSYSIENNYRIVFHYDLFGVHYNTGWLTGTGIFKIPYQVYEIKFVIAPPQGQSVKVHLVDCNFTLSSSTKQETGRSASAESVKILENQLHKLGILEMPYMSRGIRIPFGASKDKNIHISFEGAAGTGLNLLDPEQETILQELIPEGETSVDKTVTIKDTDKDYVGFIVAAYGNLTNVKVEVLKDNEQLIDEENRKYYAIKAGENGSIPFTAIDFSIGNLDGNAGEPDWGDASLRTNNFYRVIENSILSYVTVDDYRVDFHFYYLDGSHSHTGWLSGTGNLMVPDGAMSMKVVLSRPAGTSISPIHFEDTGFELSSSALPTTDYFASLTNQNKVINILPKVGIIFSKNLLRRSVLPFNAQDGDKVHISIEAEANVGIEFEDSSQVTVGQQQVVPTGSTTLEKDVILSGNVSYVKAVYGDVKINEIVVVARGLKPSILPIPIYAPSPQLPAGNESEADFNAETLTPAQLYAAYDSMIEKLAAPMSNNKFTPKYATLNSVQGDDASGQFKLRTYVFTKRNRFAWKHADRLYAWKDANDSILYVDSCSPRVGDILYSNTSRINSGKTVSSYDCATQSIVASDNVTYYIYADGDVKPDMYWTTDCLNRTGNTSSTTLTFYDRSGVSIGNATYIDDTHLSYSGKSYERCDAQDYHTDNKATIFIWANEHGPQSDPNECAITLYRLAKDLCIGCRNNDFISFLKNYCKVVFIPVANPWGMNNWATNRGNGRINYNNVNINRNYNTPGWATVADSDKGSYAGDQNETQYIMNTCLDFEADIALDMHCLGYVTANNGGKCHWHARIPNWSLNNYIADVMLGYGMSYSSYGDASPNTNSTGAEWIYFNGMQGGLIEMNAGNYASSYDGNQHSAFIMEVDYTFLLNIIRMFYYGVDPDIDFSKLGIR